MTTPLSPDANLFAGLPASADPAAAEQFDALLTRPGVRVERIVSTGQASPPGFWYDQPQHEWVALLAGGAGLAFADTPGETLVLRPGDVVTIAAHRRHRVEWTAQGEVTVWLALHYD
ncbi:cupin [Pandoraea nosoerga]|uniref:Cupin n=1 Tax=Pandoraea nosoerga TaxID=2508296 RepID=A0A5E4VZW8_9BURK|nr:MULTISPECIES: cupin [Pandoraea]MBN4666214.1 cupin [Pandoraea nosoerga]MBN4676269.1 cupin [Pandoraea nosoerga]MBN4681306.1 cupin [Pandoraea nosoerga]MBN4745381.1 cupin [Pandoraea nosoerga]VVE16844.1 cupin [Pandoraea nosoerga]